jgi:hypothetical protein
VVNKEEQDFQLVKNDERIQALQKERDILAKIERPNWFQIAVRSAATQFSLIERGMLPGLHGDFTLTMCLRLCRCVFGVQSNSEAARLLGVYAENRSQYWKRVGEILKAERNENEDIQ